LRFFYWDGDGRVGVGESDVQIPTGEWVHLAGVYDNDAGETRVYMNGQEVLTGDASSALEISGSSSVIANHANNIRLFDGMIDEVRFYGRALSADEISQLAG
jgi:hypothetical protein